MAAPAPRQSNLMASRRGSANVSSIVRGRAPPPPRRPPPTGRVIVVVSHPSSGQIIPGGLPIGNVTIVGSSLANFGEGTSQPQSAPVTTRVLPSLDVNVSTEVASHSAPVNASAPTHKRRKSRKDDDRSSSKRSRHEGSASAPLVRFLVESSAPSSISVIGWIFIWDPLIEKFLTGFLGQPW